MKAVIYARYSSDNQREESIEGQLRECIEYAVRHGLTVIGEYIDRAYSAKTDNRPEFQRMIKDSSKKKFTIVLVWKLDRFARSRTDSALNKAILKKNNVRVVSARENISEGAEGILLESLLEGYAEFFSAELAEKVVRGMTENALKQKYNGGGIPIGYRIGADQKLEFDPLTAPVVVEAYTLYSQGHTIKQIVEEMNRRGIRTYRGLPMSINSVTRMLKNRKYIGEYRFRDVVQPNGIPAIVPEDLFERVQQSMEKNRRAPARHKAEDDYLLTTKLFCGHCEAYMVGESGTSQTGAVYHYYKCVNAKKKKGCKKKTVKKDWIERLVVAEAKSMVLRDDVIDKLADMILDVDNQENTYLPLLKKQLIDVNRGIDNMLDAIQEGVVTASTKKRLEDLEARKEELEINIAREEIQKSFMTKELIVSWVSRFQTGDIDDPAYQKRIIDIFVNAIFLFDDKIIMTYNYKDSSKTVTLDQIKGSDIESQARPRRITIRGMSFLWLFVFCCDAG